MAQDEPSALCMSEKTRSGALPAPNQAHSVLMNLTRKAKSLNFHVVFLEQKWEDYLLIDIVPSQDFGG